MMIVFYPRGVPISDDELSVDSSVGHQHSELEGYEAVSPPPDPAPNIAPEGVTRRNAYSIVDTTQEGDATPVQ